MNTKSLLGSVREQEDEPAEVGAQRNGVVGTASDEAAHRFAEPIVVSAGQSCRNCSSSASSAASPVSSCTGHAGRHPCSGSDLNARSLPHGLRTQAAGNGHSQQLVDYLNKCLLAWLQASLLASSSRWPAATQSA
jgi:hypothetical protein